MLTNTLTNTHASPRRWVWYASAALAGSLLLTLSAKVQIPFWPVPMTLQTLVVLVLGMACGARLAGATVLLYLLEGALGLPVFAGSPERGVGLAYMAGPTGGFLLGFVLAALLVGWMADRGWGRSLPRIALAMLLGHAAIFLPGMLWLVPMLGWEGAVAAGLAPFWAATLVKTALGTALVPLLPGRRAARS